MRACSSDSPWLTEDVSYIIVGESQKTFMSYKRDVFVDTSPA